MPAKLRRKSIKRLSTQLPQLSTYSSSSSGVDPFFPSSPSSSPSVLASTTQSDWEQQQRHYQPDYSTPHPLHHSTSSFPSSHPSPGFSPSPTMAHQAQYGAGQPPEHYQDRSQDPYAYQQHSRHQPPPQQFSNAPPSPARYSNEQRSYSPQGAPSPTGGHSRNGSYGGQQQQQQPPPSSRPYPSSSSSPANTPARQSPVPSYASGGVPTPQGSGSKQLPSQSSSRSLASQAAGKGVGAPGGGAGGQQGPPTIAGEPLHDLGRAFALLKSSKFYAEGFLMKRVEAGPDSKPVAGLEGQWAKYFVQLSGSIMSTWNAEEMEAAAKSGSTVPPHYLNLQDAFLHPFPPSPRGPKTPTPFQFALNSAGDNRILFCAPTLQSLTMWINAIRLSVWERSRCNEIYTGTLLGLREPRGLGWQGFDAGLPGHNKVPGRFEGWIKARLPGETEWRRVWAVLQRGSNVPSRSSLVSGATSPTSPPGDEKRSRRTSLLSFGKKKQEKNEEVVIEDLPGDGAVSTLAFFDRKPVGGKKGGAGDVPLCIAQHVFYTAAIFPESEKLLDHSTLFKIEGTFLNPTSGYKLGWGVGGRGEKQGFALLMLEEGGVMDMLHWIVALADVFKLYGRPRNFSFDPRDPSSLYFALPVGPHRDRQFLDRELVDNLEMNESRPRAIRATFHNILFDRMRGVRSPILNSAGQQPQEGRSSSSQNGGSQPTSPVDSADPARRWSQVPPSASRDDAPKLPPVLPPIGEGSFGEEQQTQPNAYTNDLASPTNGARAIEPEGVTARRMSINRQHQAERRNSQYGAAQPERRLSQHHAPAPPASAQPAAPEFTPNNYLGELNLRRASQNGSSEAELGTFTSFLNSDLARERTPPPPVPASSQQMRPQYSGNNSPRMDLEPINTQVPAYPTISHSTPVQATPASTDAARSEVTHLTYAGAPSALGAQQRFDHHAQHEQSPIFTRPMPNAPLPSPGAASALNVLDDHQSQAPSSPGLAYLAESPVQQQGFVSASTNFSPVQQQQQHFGSPVHREQEQEQEQEQLQFSAPPPVPFVAAAPPPPPAQQQHQRSLSPDEAHTNVSSASNRSIGTHVSQMHHGDVVESPISAGPESTAEGAFLTQPLFAGNGSIKSRQGASAQDESLPQQHVVEQQLQEARPRTPEVEQATPVQRQDQFEYSASQPRQASTEAPVSPARNGDESSYNIHSDLLAALDYVDRSASPELEVGTPISPSSAEATPSTHHNFHIGPPKHRGFNRPPSPTASDEQYGSQQQEQHQSSAPPRVEVVAEEQGKISSGQTSASSRPEATSFPSSFAKNRREERTAAAQLAQQEKEAALTRPGRGAGQSKKKKVWVDSDEEEEEEEEDESSEDELPPRRVTNSASSASLAPSPANGSRGPSPIPIAGIPMSGSIELPPLPSQQYARSPSRSPNVDALARQSYLDNGPVPRSNYAGSAAPGSPTRDSFSTMAPTEGQPHRKPALNPHGLLAQGIIDKEERSARTMEQSARGVGNALVNLPAKPLPPQTGLVGALTSHQREKERTGGVGRALTDQQRERKLAEQRQKQLDEMQRQQLAMYQQQMQMQQFGGGFPGMGMGMGSMGYGGSNPWMMGGPAMSQMGFGGYPGGGGSQMGVPGQQQPASPLQPQGTGNSGMEAMQAMQQQQAMMMAAQQAAQAAARQAYLAAMQQFSPPISSPPGGSPSIQPSTSYSQMPSMPTMSSMGFGGGQFGAFPQGSPSFMPQNPYGYGHGQQPSFGGGSQFGLPQQHQQQFQQQQQQGATIGTAQTSAENSDNERGGAMSPLDLQGRRREGTD